MRVLGNIIWFIFGGWWTALLYILWGVIFCITIVGIPIGKACFQYAKLMAFPFGKVIVKETFIKGKENVSIIRRFFGTLVNIIWLPIGIIMLLGTIGTMILLCVTIIGIPVAIVLAKSCKFLLWPVGAKVISKEEYQAIITAQVIERRNSTVSSAAPVAPTIPLAPVSQQIPTDQVEPERIESNTVDYAADVNIENSNENVSAQAITNAAQAFGSTVVAGGANAVHAIGKGGASAIQAIGKGSANAAAAARQKYGEGMDALRAHQQTITEEILAKEQRLSFVELLKEAERGLYNSKLMTWIMPFLEAVTIALAILFAVIGMVWYGLAEGKYLYYGGGASKFLCIVYGLFSGLYALESVMLAACLLGAIKQRHKMVIGILGGGAVVTAVVRFFQVSIVGVHFQFSGIWSAIPGVALYICLLIVYCSKMRKSSEPAFQMSGRSTASDGITAASVKFCSKCGNVIAAGNKFCAKCGNPTE